MVFDSPKGAEPFEYVSNTVVDDLFDQEELNIHFLTLRVPFSERIGKIENGQLHLNGLASLANVHENSLV
ncbi:glycoside hydrolase 43 family protein, partial [Enterococcus faecium]